MSELTTTVRATIVQTPEPGRFERLERHDVVIEADGTIRSVAPADDTVAPDVMLDADHVLLPGMVDTHLHAPQWPQLGVGLDLPLERWLFEYTFPLEARFADVEYSTKVWAQMVPALLRHGTTTAVYYGSIHEDATTALAEVCIRHGQRAFVGRVAMDHPDGTPDWYRDPSAAAAVDASSRSIDAVRRVDGGRGLVEPIITPRFVPACTDAALTGLGELAAATGVRVQTHCSESDWEHGHVLDRCGVTDAHALDRFGLLRDHSVLAHATHLTDADRSLLAATGAGVSHCPLSNVYFANRPFRARAALDAGVRVGLGTDVAGGPSPSLLSQCSHAVVASQQLADAGDPSARIDIATAFWMATLGGADLVGADVGLIAPGRAFDAIAVRVPDVACRSDGDDDRDDVFEERIVRLAGPQDIVTVWVAGTDVTPAG
ncbi:MAG: amidohydrolase family protein [Ilumatobacteraceae bacterium]|nr:amidohydrolase family protein [Ilumatobacteraceae bacterium]